MPAASEIVAFWKKSKIVERGETLRGSNLIGSPCCFRFGEHQVSALRKLDSTRQPYRRSMLSYLRTYTHYRSS
jgi:hypothetical protein